jgi:hypothetical protein
MLIWASKTMEKKKSKPTSHRRIHHEISKRILAENKIMRSIA